MLAYVTLHWNNLYFIKRYINICDLAWRRGRWNFFPSGSHSDLTWLMKKTCLQIYIFVQYGLCNIQNRITSCMKQYALYEQKAWLHHSTRVIWKHIVIYYLKFLMNNKTKWWKATVVKAILRENLNHNDIKTSPEWWWWWSLKWRFHLRACFLTCIQQTSSERSCETLDIQLF